MVTKNNIMEVLRKEQPMLKSKFGVKKIAVFGSFANGTPNKNSDVDIFIELEKPIGLRFVKLTDYLEKKLGRKADVLTPGGIAGIRIKRVAENIRRSMIYV